MSVASTAVCSGSYLEGPPFLLDTQGRKFEAFQQPVFWDDHHAYVPMWYFPGSGNHNFDWTKSQSYTNLNGATCKLSLNRSTITFDMRNMTATELGRTNFTYNSSSPSESPGNFAIGVTIVDNENGACGDDPPTFTTYFSERFDLKP